MVECMQNSFRNGHYASDVIKLELAFVSRIAQNELAYSGYTPSHHEFSVVIHEVEKGAAKQSRSNHQTNST